MEERRKIPIPEDVVNAREYLKWYAYNSHPLLRNPRQIVSTGEEVSLGLMPHLFAKAIEHLSTKEQEDLMEMKKKWMSKGLQQAPRLMDEQDVLGRIKERIRREDIS